MEAEFTNVELVWQSRFTPLSRQKENVRLSLASVQSVLTNQNLVRLQGNPMLGPKPLHICLPRCFKVIGLFFHVSDLLLQSVLPRSSSNRGLRLILYAR
jgi:hypothetical protein